MRLSTRALLTFVAGFCDTATFVHMGGVFSAHVTGNFVLFAASLAQGFKPQDYLKIMTFPFFVVGIVGATLIYARVVNRQNKQAGLVSLLRWQSLIFTVCTLTLLGSQWGDLAPWRLYYLDMTVTMALVVGLAIQNTLHRFVTVPLTTVMTGTVMNTTAGLTEKYLLRQGGTPEKAKASPMLSLGLIFSFAMGCILAGFSTHRWGLGVIGLPMVLVWAASLLEEKNQNRGPGRSTL